MAEPQNSRFSVKHFLTYKRSKKNIFNIQSKFKTIQAIAFFNFLKMAILIFSGGNHLTHWSLTAYPSPG